MAFDNLEKRLPESQYDIYLDITRRLKEPFNSTLRYMLDMASVFEEVKLKDQYALFGGYAVLTHIVDQFGDKIIPTWRGSQDIDLIGTNKIITTLKSFYNVESDNASPNIKGKRTLKIDENNRECKVDFTLAKPEEFRYDVEEKMVLGIPVEVINPYNLIKSKLSLAHQEDIHRIDVSKLLCVIEHRGGMIKDLVDRLNEEQRLSLYKLLETKDTRELTANKRMDFGPSRDYLSLLKNYLKKVVMYKV